MCTVRWPDWGSKRHGEKFSNSEAVACYGLYFWILFCNHSLPVRLDSFLWVVNSSQLNHFYDFECAIKFAENGFKFYVFLLLKALFFWAVSIHTTRLCGMSKRWSCGSLMDGFDHVTHDATAEVESQLIKRMEEHGDPTIVVLSEWLLFTNCYCYLIHGPMPIPVQELQLQIDALENPSTVETPEVSNNLPDPPSNPPQVGTDFFSCTKKDWTISHTNDPI